MNWYQSEEFRKPVYYVYEHSFFFLIYGLKQDVWFHNTESIIIVDYLQLMTTGNGKEDIEARDFYYFGT
jgi:hypothetical protein